MIPVAPVPEPSSFDARARRPGNAWLLEHPHARRPRNYWSPFRSLLEEGFKHRCGYSAMREPNGTVDHFHNFKDHPALTYEWGNYRYASSWLNSIKKTRTILDPYEIEHGWFEVLLPSLQLVLTDKVPPAMRPRAEATLKVLPLSHDERVLKQRRGWYEMYRARKLSLEGLRDVAPLIAAAVEKQLGAIV
jgi:hypothetical protein